MLKKEKEREEKNISLEEKKLYNENYKKYAEERDNDLNNRRNEKIMEKEAKEKNIAKLKNELEQLNKELKIFMKAYNEAENNLMNLDDDEEQLRNKFGFYNKKNNQNKKAIKLLGETYENTMKTYKEEFNLMMKNKTEFKKQDSFLDLKKKKINEMNSRILCIKCNTNQRDVIFCECSHLTLCRYCLEDMAEEKGNRTKAFCPACNIMSRRFFFIKTDK